MLLEEVGQVGLDNPQEDISTLLHITGTTAFVAQQPVDLAGWGETYVESCESHLRASH